MTKSKKQTDKQIVENDITENETWENQHASISFWDFRKYPEFIGTFSNNATIENRDKTISTVYIFIEAETQEAFYINEYSAIKNVLNKESKESTPEKKNLNKDKKLLYRIILLEQIELTGGRKFNKFDVFTKPY